MSAAAAAILDGAPGPRDLHGLDTGRETLIFAGRVQLFRFAGDDTAMRHVAAAVLRQLGFRGQDVARVLGLTPSYVATLHQRALREGTAALVRPAGRPRETGEASWERARAWRAAGVRDAEIARRLGVNQSTVLRRLGPASVQGELPAAEAAAGDEEPAPGAKPPAREEELAGGPAAGPGPAGDEEPGPDEPGPPAPPGPGGGAAGGGGRVVSSRYAGAMLLHAFGGRAGAGEILSSAAGGEPGEWRCCRRSACASRWARRPSSSSSTWPRPTPGRWPGWARCQGCGRCGPGWPRSPTAPTRWRCSGCSPPRCWPPTRSSPGCITSMTTSSPTPAPSRSPRAGTTSAARRNGAAPTPT